MEPDILLSIVALLVALFALWESRRANSISMFEYQLEMLEALEAIRLEFQTDSFGIRIASIAKPSVELAKTKYFFSNEATNKTLIEYAEIAFMAAVTSAKLDRIGNDDSNRDKLL
tara:strand:- start:1292 stop:1636 length:345 start_codon:yes stop_codon:yes gene_type:complete